MSAMCSSELRIEDLTRTPDATGTLRRQPVAASGKDLRIIPVDHWTDPPSLEEKIRCLKSGLSYTALSSARPQADHLVDNASPDSSIVASSQFPPSLLDVPSPAGLYHLPLFASERTYDALCNLLSASTSPSHSLDLESARYICDLLSGEKELDMRLWAIVCRHLRRWLNSNDLAWGSDNAVGGRDVEELAAILARLARDKQAESWAVQRKSRAPFKQDICGPSKPKSASSPLASYQSSLPRPIKPAMPTPLDSLQVSDKENVPLARPNRRLVEHPASRAPPLSRPLIPTLHPIFLKPPAAALDADLDRPSLLTATPPPTKPSIPKTRPRATAILVEMSTPLRPSQGLSSSVKVVGPSNTAHNASYGHANRPPIEHALPVKPRQPLADITRLHIISKARGDSSSPHAKQEHPSSRHPLLNAIQPTVTPAMALPKSREQPQSNTIMTPKTLEKAGTRASARTIGTELKRSILEAKLKKEAIAGKENGGDVLQAGS